MSPKDCPWCGLINPHEAVMCDCGYDFVGKRTARTLLSDSDVAKAQDAKLPVYVPSGCSSFLLLLLIAGTNGPGACLVAIAFATAALVGATIKQGPGVYLIAFGVTAIVCDALARRWAKCGPLDLKRGSRFAGFPVWMIGLGIGVTGLGIFLADV